jgi:hypothetical protein
LLASILQESRHVDARICIKIDFCFLAMIFDVVRQNTTHQLKGLLRQLKQLRLLDVFLLVVTVVWRLPFNPQIFSLYYLSNIRVELG